MASNRKIILKAEYNILAKVHWINIDSRKHGEKMFLPNPSPQEYVQQILKESSVEAKDIKAIAFIYNDVEMDTWKKAYEFRQGCYEFCQKHGIFYFNSTTIAYHNFIATLRSKVIVNEGEHMTVIYAEMNGVLGSTYIRENDRWKCVNIHIGYDFEPTQEWKRTFMKNYKPKRFVFMYHMAAFDFQQVINLFKEKNSIILAFDYNFLTTAYVDKILHVMGEKLIPYDIAPQCTNVYGVNLGRNNLITVTYEDILPFEKSGIIDVNPSKAVTLNARLSISHPFELVETIKLSTFKCKKVKVTLKIDANYLYDFKVEPVGAEDLCDQFEELSILKPVEKPPFSPRKVQIVFNKQECRLIFTCDNGCTHPIPDLDGLEKTPIYIAFTAETPLIGKSAKEVYRQKPDYVVFDIIKLCSTTNHDIESPKWGFTVSKEDDALMVSVQTVDGERKSTVDFLLALVIKNALKPQLMGGDKEQKWDQAEIAFEDFTPNETLKKAFISAGKLLKMNIVFS
uniref:Uncharacterized protein n=1 Tax=Panagrolaimus sp. PS1159 TaxID=55785 RepID=A0AC35EWC4_9BILA